MSAFDEVCTEVRSLVNSSKDQMSVSALLKDYTLVIGSPLPYRKLGYKTVEDLLRAIPNLRLNRVGNDTYIDMKPDEKTAHITKMVQEQKSASKKKKKFGRPPPSRTSFNHRSTNNHSGSFRSNSTYNTHNNYNNNFRGSGSTDHRTNNFRTSNTRNDNRRQPPSQHRFDFNNKKKEDEPRYMSSYRSSTLTQYDFSDPEDECDEMDSFAFGDECKEEVKEFSIDNVAKDFQNLRFTVSNSPRGAGRGYALLRGGANRSPESGLTENLPNKPPANVKMTNASNSIKNSTSFDPGYCDDWDDSVPDTDLPNDYSPAAACNDWDDTVEGDDDVQACSRNDLVDVVNSTNTEVGVLVGSRNGLVEVVDSIDTEDGAQACSRNGLVDVVNSTDTSPKYLTTPFDDWDDSVPGDNTTISEGASSFQNVTKPDDCDDTVVITSSPTILDNCSSVQQCEVQRGIDDSVANMLEEQLSENASHVDDVVRTNGDDTATKSSVRECEVQGTDDYERSRLEEKLSENASNVGDVQTNGDDTATKSNIRECDVQGSDVCETSGLKDQLSENTSHVSDVVQMNGDDTAMESSHTPSSIRSVHAKAVDNGNEGSKNSLEEDVINHERENVIQCSGSCVRSSDDGGGGLRGSTGSQSSTSTSSETTEKSKPKFSRRYVKTLFE